MTGIAHEPDCTSRGAPGNRCSCGGITLEEWCGMMLRTAADPADTDDKLTALLACVIETAQAVDRLAAPHTHGKDGA